MDVAGRHSQVEVNRLEAELHATRARLDSILSSLDEYLYAWRFPAVGPAIIEFESIPQAVFLRQASAGGTPEDDWLRAIHPDERSGAVDVLAAQSAGERGSYEYRLGSDESGWRWLLDTWTCRRDANGDVIAEGIVSDVTVRRRAQDGLAAALAVARLANAELEKARRDAERASETDPLTGLANRRSFACSLDAAVAESTVAPFGLIALDVDRFKRINDTLGHHAGDDVLVGVVKRIRDAAPANAILGRWGGEEFTVLLPGVAGEQPLRAIGDAIRQAVRAGMIPTRVAEIAVTVSCGCVLSAEAMDGEELLHTADSAMLHAKQSGRNRTLLSRDPSPATSEGSPELLLLAESFAQAAGTRGGVVEPHAGDVAELAGRIADELDLPVSTVLRCRMAGWLHDVGKVAIPNSVLDKPGALDDEERLVMQTHAARGSEMVARTPGIAESARAVRHHHERWDGYGYPDRLTGADIPIEARIVAAADTWNAMTHDRVYRSALAFDEAIAELSRAAGSQFDPNVADALLRVVSEQHRLHEVPQAA